MSTQLMRPAIAIAALILSASCADGAADPGVDEQATITLPLRVHVLSSVDSRLSSTSTDAQVQAMLDRVNQIWSAADVRFELESIVREPIDDAVLVPIPGSSAEIILNQLLLALPLQNRIAAGFDLFIVHDLASVAGVPGVFFPQIPAAAGSEVDPAGLNDPGRILAHELGHALTLPHVDCTSEGNLMSPGCAGADRGRLTSAQIAAARAQALTGRPIGG